MEKPTAKATVKLREKLKAMAEATSME